jgi:hypothetical protein
MILKKRKGVKKMKTFEIQLTDFVQKEGFELNSYLICLFIHFHNNCANGEKKIKTIRRVKR